jgi:hypothetical protein
MIRVLAVVVALGAAASLAPAHEGGKHKALHGGQVVATTGDHGHHLELVAKDGELTLYVRDDEDKPDTVKGAKASATVLAGGKQATVKLEPREPNILAGKGSFTVAKGTKVVVTVTLPDHRPFTARFTPAD